MIEKHEVITRHNNTGTSTFILKTKILHLCTIPYAVRFRNLTRLTPGTSNVDAVFHRSPKLERVPV